MLKILFFIPVALGNKYAVMQRSTDVFGTRSSLGDAFPWSVTFSIWARFRAQERVVFASDGNYQLSPYMFSDGLQGALSLAGKIFIAATGFQNVTTSWHHYVTVVDRDDSRLLFYKDGEFVDFIALTEDDLATATIDDGLIFGKFARWNDDNYLAKTWPEASIYGYIDEVKLWSEAISSEAVQALFEQGLSSDDDSSPVIHYDMESETEASEESNYVVVKNMGSGGSIFDAVFGAYPSRSFDYAVTRWAVETSDGCTEFIDATVPLLRSDDVTTSPNQPPVVERQELSVVEGELYARVYLYAWDPDGDWIEFFTLTQLPSHGELYEVSSIDASSEPILVSSVPYTPTYPHFSFLWYPAGEETTSLVATATDSRGATSPEAVAILELITKNDAPTTKDVNLQINEDVDVLISITGVDSDSTFLNLIIDSLPTHGSLYEVMEDGAPYRDVFVGPVMTEGYASWRVTEPVEQFATTVHAVSSFFPSPPNDEFEYPSWHPYMTTGPPSVDTYGDSRKAWSPLNRNAPEGSFSGGDDLLTFGPWEPRTSFDDNGYSEYIEIDFDIPVYLQNVRVGMPRGMGSIVAVRSWDEITMAWHVVYEGAADPDYERYMALTRQYSVFEPRPACQTAFKVSRIRIELDTVTVADWNEIDYVQLVGTTQKQASEVRMLESLATLLYVPDANFEGEDSLSSGSATAEEPIAPTMQQRRLPSPT